MRMMLLSALALLVSACQFMPTQPDAEAATPEEIASKSIDVADERLAEQLADAFQSLHDGRTRPAVDEFNDILERSVPGQPFHNRALLGKSLAYLDSEWEQYDPQQARHIVNRIGRDEERSQSVFDWILRDTVARLIEEETQGKELATRLADAERRQRSLRVELEQARAEQTQAEETITRLRQLIMGQD